jgi:hypothetical protein
MKNFPKLNWAIPLSPACAESPTAPSAAEEFAILGLAEKRGSSMGSNKKALLLFILLLVTGVIIFWTSGFTLKMRSGEGKDAAICTIKCEPKAGFPACVARCTQD